MQKTWTMKHVRLETSYSDKRSILTKFSFKLIKENNLSSRKNHLNLCPRKNFPRPNECEGLFFLYDLAGASRVINHRKNRLMIDHAYRSCARSVPASYILVVGIEASINVVYGYLSISYGKWSLWVFAWETMKGTNIFYLFNCMTWHKKTCLVSDRQYQINKCSTLNCVLKPLAKLSH